MKHSTSLFTALMALTLFSAPTLANADEAGATASLEITLTDLSTSSGTVRLGLFPGEDGYSGNAALTGANVVVEGHTASVTLENVPPGSYGIKLYHDVNDNGELDTNPFGMPREPYAFSNNAQGRFGPASWGDAAFEVIAGQNTHTISVGG